MADVIWIGGGLIFLLLSLWLGQRRYKPLVWLSNGVVGAIVLVDVAAIVWAIFA